MSAVLQERPTAAPIPVSETTGLSDDVSAAARAQALYDAGAFAPTDEQGRDLPPEQIAEMERRAQGGQQAEAAPAQQQAPQGDQQQQAPQDEGPEYQDLTDYLTKSQIEPDSFYKMPVTVKVDGQTKNVPLAEVIKSYQLEGHVNNKSIALAEQQRNFEAQRQQAMQTWGAQIKQAQTLGQLAHQQLLGEYQSIDWNKLRMEDPTRWAVANQEFNNRAAAIQQHLQQVQQQEQLQQQSALALAAFLVRNSQ